MGSPFLTSNFADLFHDVSNIIAIKIEVDKSDSTDHFSVTLVIYKPNFFLRFGIIYDFPNNINPHLIDSILSKVINYCRIYHCWYLEIRNSKDNRIYNSNFDSFGFQYKPWLNALLHLHDNWENGISKSKRRNIQKGVKTGLYFKVCQNKMEVFEAYLLICSQYRKIRKPLPDIKLFYNSFDNPKFSKVFNTYFGSNLVATSLVLLNDFTAAQFIFAADKNNINYTQSASFHQWSLIEWSYKNGFTHIDLVGGGEKNKPYGVREFKRRFGATFNEVGRWNLVFYPIRWNLIFVINNIISKKLI